MSTIVSTSSTQASALHEVCFLDSVKKGAKETCHAIIDNVGAAVQKGAAKSTFCCTELAKKGADVAIDEGSLEIVAAKTTTKTGAKLGGVGFACWL